jgi:hypothetical protein
VLKACAFSEMMETLSSGAYLVVGLRLLEVCPSRDSGNPAHSYLSVSLPGCHEVRSFALPRVPAMVCCLSTGPKLIGLTDHGLMPPKP